ncbi:MAG: UbiA prenyltransferase family protein, partial [Myxococcales bacterium]|nr:UbiA prenyltransferase family protein [Myxococcales bacterium]
MVEEPAEARQPTPLPLAALKQLRLKQWAKQVFLVPALVFSGEFLDPSAILRVLVAILSFSLLASAGYILNDYLDREADRQHPKKRFRPIASGDLPIPAAFALFAAAVVGGVALGWWLSPMFLVIAFTYLATTLSYSFYFKHRVILDVMFLALGFVWRVVAGAFAIKVQVSAWLFLCTAFFSL